MTTIKSRPFPHQFLNLSKGVTKCPELSLCSSEEIENDDTLKKQGVTDVKRMQVKRDDTIINTNTYILTFEKPTLSKEIKIGYTIAKVEPYIPNPRRCHKCQKFGHLQNICTRTSVCRRCGGTRN